METTKMLYVVICWDSLTSAVLEEWPSSTRKTADDVKLQKEAQYRNKPWVTVDLVERMYLV